MGWQIKCYQKSFTVLAIHTNVSMANKSKQSLLTIIIKEKSKKIESSNSL